MNRNKQKEGSSLVVVVVSIVATAILGTAFMAMATSSRYTRLNLSTTNRAYYLAESGAVYVRAIREADGSAVPSGTFTLANGDQFQITTSTNSTGLVTVQSIGIVNAGTSLESRQQVSFNFRRRVDPRTLNLGFDNDGDGELDREWEFTSEGVQSGQIPVISTPPEGGSALELQNWQGNFQLNWAQNPLLDLVQAWSNNNKRMSYDVQAKLSAAKQDGNANSPVFNSILLVGLGVRLQPDKLSGYGVSFFRFHPSYPRNAPWTNDLDSTFLNTLRSTNVYITLWSRQYPGKRNVIAYRRIRFNDGLLISSPLASGQYDIKPFSTILVSLKEDYVGVTTNRVNKISVYLSNTNVYPRWPEGIQNYAYAKWQEDTNTYGAPVRWDNLGGATVVTNNLFTSSTFDTLKPPEINLHVYDYAVKFFDDFVMRVDGYVTPASPGGQIQY